MNVDRAGGCALHLCGAAAVLSGDAASPADVQRLLDALGAASVDEALAKANGTASRKR